MMATLAVMLVTLGAYAQTPQEVADKFNEAAEKINAKNFIEAVPLLEETVKMGEAVGDEAAEVTDKARKLLPGMYFQAGGSYIQQGKPEEALKYFETSLQKAEELKDVNVATRAKGWIGNTYLQMGAKAFNAKDFQAAAEIFEKGYEVAPNNTEIATNLAVSYAELKEYDKSYETFRNIIALEQHGDKYAKAVDNAKNRMAHYMMVNASAIASAQPAKAIDLLAEAVEVNPGNPQAYMLLLQTANNSKNYNKVIEFGAKAADVQTDAAQKSNAYFFLGAAYDNTGNKAKAIENYRKVTSGPNAAAAKSQVEALSK